MCDKKLNQTNSMQVFQIDGRSLTSSFDFALVASDDAWGRVLEEINLQADEVMRVSSVNHSVALSRHQDGTYIVYDPNYDMGFKTFKTAQDVIQELHTNVFAYQPGVLGLSIDVTRRPDADPREFPSVADLYERYLPEDGVNRRSGFGNRTKSTLEMAAYFADERIITQLIEKGASDVDAALEMAIINNNPEAIKALLPCLKADIEDKKNLSLFRALNLGCKEVCDELLKDAELKNLYAQMLQSPRHMSLLIGMSAAGGNLALLTQIFSDNERWIREVVSREMRDAPEGNKELEVMNGLKEFCEGIFIIRPGKEKDAIMKAIDSGQVDCIRFLLDKVKQSGLDLKVEQSFDYLLYAIRTNKVQAVEHLLDELPNEALNSVRMSARAVSKTDYSILKALQERGVSFSSTAEAIIAKKEHQSIGFFKSLGITIKKFTDFLQEKLTKKSGVTCHKKTFEAFREQYHQMKSEENSHKEADHDAYMTLEEWERGSDIQACATI